MLKPAVFGLLVAAFAILISGAFVLVVMNRASEKVITASVPIALAALAGIALVFIFSEEPAVSRVFPVTFVRIKEGGAPANIPYRRNRNVEFLVNMLPKGNSVLANDPQLVYHHLLQKALLEWIALRHWGAWETEQLAFDTGAKLETFGPLLGSSEPSKVFSSKDLETMLGENLFARIALMSFQLAVPPNTNVTITVPTSEPLSKGEIRFQNRFCTLTLTTNRYFGMVGIGPFTQITDITIDEAQRRFWSETYTVRGTVTFNKLRVGDPNLPIVKRWAVQILEGLQHEFDEQIVWREARETFLLRQAAGPGGIVGRGEVAR
jgi:hypothetical protein